MKIAFWSDVQISGKLLRAADAQLGAAVEQCIARGVSLVVDCGDLFERSSIGDEHASTGAIAEVWLRRVKRLADAGIEFVALVGNHDVSGAGSADALHVFDGMRGVTVARHPMLLGRGDESLILLPWSWNDANPVAGLDRLAMRKGCVLAAHIEVIGARMQGSRCCEPVPGKWQINRADLEAFRFEHVALGHFHARQDLLDGRGGYVGALLQHNFGEEDNPTGFEIYDTETRRAEWVELDAAPRFRTLRPTDSILEGARGIEASPDDNWRVRFAGEPDIADVKALEAAGVRVEIEVQAQERTIRAEVKPGIVGQPRELLELWASTQTPPLEAERMDAARAMLDRVQGDQGATS
jgi:DNA repair exonuclease SbcCD nuclease subunit